ncbi:cation:proton antiporter regulatory subunit [Marinobacter sp.]|uniref:cation:proton antiporter regulatory subunit n=1 Tax=Marinobacter sp. TaxID=50741 RepID=UPI003A8E05BA
MRILDGDPAAGKTIAETLGEQQQVLASALVRDGVRLRKPPLDTVLKPGDVLVVLGPQNEIDALQLRMTGADEARTL